MGTVTSSPTGILYFLPLMQHEKSTSSPSGLEGMHTVTMSLPFLAKELTSELSTEVSVGLTLGIPYESDASKGYELIHGALEH